MRTRLLTRLFPDNKLGPEGARVLFSALERNSTLIKLKLFREALCAKSADAA